jgi:hypothetical protein
VSTAIYYISVEVKDGWKLENGEKSKQQQQTGIKVKPIKQRSEKLFLRGIQNTQKASMMSHLSLL